MKKVYLVHGWSGSSEDNWFPWLKNEIEKHNVEVIVFNMPNSEHPKIEEWVEHLKENICLEDIDEHTFFIGHSIGCQTIMRFLEKLHKNKKIAGCVFVAPWIGLINLEPEEIKIAHPWTNTNIDFGRILEHCNNFLCFFSDDDSYVHLDESIKFKEKLAAKIIIEKNKGHFEEKIQERILEESLKFLKTK